MTSLRRDFVNEFYDTFIADAPLKLNIIFNATGIIYMKYRSS